MTDYVRDTAPEARPYCPTCEADVDHAGELLDVRWCSQHRPPSEGEVDAALPAELRESYPAGSGEAGGPDNRAFCDFLHRTARRK